MKLLQFLRAAAFSTMLAAALGGCAIHQASKVQQSIDAQANAAVDTPVKSRPTVQVHDGAWLLGEKIHASKPQPEIFDKTVLFRRSGGASLNEIATFIAENVGVPAILDPSAEGTASPSGVTIQGSSGARSVLPMPGSTTGGLRMPMIPSLGGAIATSGVGSTDGSLKYYSGTFKGFLDVTNAHYGVWSRYRDGAVTFFRTETRTFDLPSIADSAAMSGTISTGNSSSGGSGGGSPSSGASGGSQGSSGNSGDQNISLSVQSTPWATLQNTAQAIAGAGATVITDQNLGMLTVTGTPPQCDRVEDWVKNLSTMFGKQVAIDVHIYQIQTTANDNFGLNLQVAYQSATGHTGISVAGAAAPTVTSSSTPMSFGATILGGSLKGTNAAVQALSTLGNLSQLFSRSGVTQNGKLLALQAAKQQGYVQSTQSMQTASVGSSVTMQTATLVPGFTSSFLPKVVDGRILIDFDMTLSDLLDLQTFTVGSGSSASSVQLPTMQVTRFEQSVSLKPGDTLVLTGMRQQNAQTTANGVGSPYMPLLGGGVNAEKDDTVIAVVISARLM